MCSGIQWISTNWIQPTASFLCSQAEKAISAAENGTAWLGRRIDDLTHSFLPKRVAVVASAFIKSAPFIAMRLFCPLPIVLAGIGAVVLYKVITTPKGEAIKAHTLLNGLSFGGLINGCRQVVSGLMANTLGGTLLGVFDIAASFFMMNQSGLIQEVTA
jgi:hypothetical protein